MLTVRTDLAAEAHVLHRESTGETTELNGVRARDEMQNGYSVHRVEILDQESAQALGKPAGTYLTLDLSPLRSGDSDGFAGAARTIADLISPMLPEDGCVLVCGIGNRRMAITRDTMGCPVMGIGVPTVVDSATLVWDALDRAGMLETEVSAPLAEVLERGRSFIVSPGDCDAMVELMARLLARALDKAFGVGD